MLHFYMLLFVDVEFIVDEALQQEVLLQAVVPKGSPRGLTEACFWLVIGSCSLCYVVEAFLCVYIELKNILCTRKTYNSQPFNCLAPFLFKYLYIHQFTCQVQTYFTVQERGSPLFRHRLRWHASQLQSAHGTKLQLDPLPVTRFPASFINIIVLV